MDEGQGCTKGFLGMVGGAVLLIFLMLILAFATTANSETAQQIANNLHEEKLAALPQNDAQFSDQKTADIVQDMTSGIVAVAVSADISQTKIAQAIPASFYALGFVFLSVAALIFALKFSGGGSKKNRDNPQVQEIEPERMKHYNKN